MKFDQRYFRSHTYKNVSFAKFSQYWWANRYYSMIVQRYTPKKGSVLEIGCGLGHFLGMLDRDYRTIGIDVNRWALKQAGHNAPNSIMKYMSAEDVGVFPKSRFNAVIAKHVVEHLKNPALVLKKINRILKPDGLLLLVTPNPSNLLRHLKGDSWIGLLDPTHISVKTPTEWKSLVKAAGFDLLKAWSDGFWNAPYLPLIPRPIQKVLFCSPGGIQAILGLSFLPVSLGESTIILAKKSSDIE